MNTENLIRHGSKILKRNDIKTFLLDSELILSKIMKVSRENLLINNNLTVSSKIKKQFNKALKRRAKKEPIAYINKSKEFWSIKFLVSKNTLIPRPETELLVDEVLKLFNNKAINILDVGSGSGCILLSLLTELRNSRGIGIDISGKAVQVAKKNSKRLNLFKRSKFYNLSLESFNSGKFDLIVSNPPYISFKDLKNLSEDIRHFEPSNALNGGIDGLDLTKKVIYKSKKLLKTNGILAIEIGNNQYIKVSKTLRKCGFREIGKVCDISRNVRCIINTKL